MAQTQWARWTVRDAANERDWVRAHTVLTRLARERAAADAEEGHWLLQALRSGAHVHLGHGSFGEYAERLFGYSRRTTREKLRVAAALERLPLSTQAIEQGKLTWCAARELTRVATPETEPAWLEAALGKTTRELERMVTGKQPGDSPPRPTDPEPPRPRVLRFEVSPETYATFRQATSSLRHAAGTALDDDALLLEMARRVLGAPEDDGRSGYQLAYELCPACGQGAQIAAGERFPVSAEVVDMACCDAVQLPARPIPPANENAAAPNPPAHSPHTAATHAGHQRAARQRPARQAVPPALRRAVLARDHRCCSVPGCTNSHFVDVHHISPRSEGGRNTIDNLITLCTAHHRAAHYGQLILERSETGLRFCHADGTTYGQPVMCASANAQAKVFAALRHLGFREREVHAVLTDIRDDPELSDAPLDRLLREALRRIRPGK